MKPLLRILLIAFVNLLIFAGCCCRKFHKSEKPSQKEAPYSGINVKIPAGGSLTDLTSEVYTKFGIRIDPNIHVRTCPCDTTLVNVNYPGLVFTGHGQLPAKPDPQGHGDTLNLPGFIAFKNYVIYSDEKIEKEPGKYPDPKSNILSTYSGPPNPSGAVTIAIFDSGLDGQYLDKSYVGVPAELDTCLSNNISQSDRDIIQSGGKVKGLNFAPADFGSNNYRISNLLDTHPKQHGTNVAALIVNQYSKEMGSKALRLLIMRVLNDQNTGDGFGIMCATYHARLLGADIYNMSLGYYGPEDPILKQYIESIKANKPSWLVAAAGNGIAAYDIPNSNPTDAKNRNLDKRIISSKFYPAYFSSSLDHVVSVTTATNALTNVCPNQNYDPKSVNAGIFTDNCTFNPGITGFVRGTSYATPVATGWIAAQENINGNRSSLLTPAPTNSSLVPFIVNGKYIKYAP